MNLYDKLSPKTRTLIVSKKEDNPNITDKILNGLKGNMFATDVTLFIALSVMDIVEPEKPFNFVNFYNLFE